MVDATVERKVVSEELHSTLLYCADPAAKAATLIASLGYLKPSITNEALERKGQEFPWPFKALCSCHRKTYNPEKICCKLLEEAQGPRKSRIIAELPYRVKENRHCLSSFEIALACAGYLEA